MKIGVDMGGSHIGVGLVDNGKIIDKKAFMYINRKNSNSLMKEIEKAIEYVNTFIKEGIVESVGISLPGNCENGVLLDAVNIRNFNMAGCHVVDILKKKLKVPVYIENDALCAIIGEKIYGSLKNYNEAMMFTFGTGVGFAMYVQENKNIYFQDNDTRDFLDHYTASFEVSLTALRTLKRVYAHEINNTDISRMKIFDDIKNGNKQAQKLLEKYIQNNCVGIERLYNLTKINTFCIGGGLSEHGDLFIDMIKDKLPNLDILLAQNQNDAGLIGATELQNIKKRRFEFEVDEKPELTVE